MIILSHLWLSLRGVIEGYAGLDREREAAEQGTAHDLDIISGATVTVMVIDDSPVHGGSKVARALEMLLGPRGA